MEEQQAILEEYLNNVGIDIIVAQEQLGIRTTGFSANSVKVLKGTHSGQAFLSSQLYLNTNFDKVGRKPGGRPPQQDIADWVRNKGIQLRDRKTGRFLAVEQTAFLIARKIGKLGTDIYTGKRKGIDIKGILKENLPPTGRKLAQAYAREYAQQIKRAAT